METQLAKNATPAQQLHQVYEWVVAGASEHDIEGAVAEFWPDAKAGPLILKAMKGIARSADPDPDVVKGWAIEATRTIYQKSMEVADHQTALRAIKQLAELTDVFNRKTKPAQAAPDRTTARDAGEVQPATPL